MERLKCPCCGDVLEKSFHGKGLYFRCPGCDGRLITVSGLRNICRDKMLVNRLWSSARYGESRPGSVCPGCGAAMRQVTLAWPGLELELDLCCSCQFVWFDPHELECIPLAEAENNDLPPRVKEMLALQKIRELEERSSGVEIPDGAWRFLLGLLGMSVELDSTEYRRLPLVTWALGLVCVAAFGLTWRYPELVTEWGFIPSEWTRRYGATVLVSMFLHSGVGHLVSNLCFLLVFGDNVENEFGHAAFLLLALASGLSALLLHSLLDPAQSIPCVGASGFISGIIAAYAVCFPRRRLAWNVLLRCPMAAMSSSRGWITIPVWFAFVLWLLLQLILAALRSGGGGVACFAHLGGVLPGIIFAVWRRRRGAAG